jgi:hypothetical protein
VLLTVIDSDALAPGCFMSLEARRGASGGSDVHGVWEQSSKNAIGLVGLLAMRMNGRRFLARYYKSVYDRLAADG